MRVGVRLVAGRACLPTRCRSHHASGKGRVFRRRVSAQRQLPRGSDNERTGVLARSLSSDLACAPQDIRTFQQLDIPVYIDPTRTPNWSAALPTSFATTINSETQSQSCVGGDVGCNAAPAIPSPANAWTG